MSEVIRLGARLRAARKAAGFKTSKEYLKKFKLPASTYSQHESGARTPDDQTLEFYSKTLKVDFDWLKSGEGLPFNTNDSTKKSIFTEELIDLNDWKTKISKRTSNKLSHSQAGSIAFNSELLTAILKELLHSHNTGLSEKAINSLAKDAGKIYRSVIHKISNEIIKR